MQKIRLETLQKCKGEDYINPLKKMMWIDGDFFYVTNRFIIVKLPLSMVDGNLETVPVKNGDDGYFNTDEMFGKFSRTNQTSIVSEKWLQKISKMIPPTQEETVCQECDGSGEITVDHYSSWTRRHYQITCECPVCDGEGSIFEPLPTCYFQMNDVEDESDTPYYIRSDFFADVYEIFKDSGESKMNVKLKTDETHLVAFWFGDVDIFVSPMINTLKAVQEKEAKEEMVILQWPRKRCNKKTPQE